MAPKKDSYKIRINLSSYGKETVGGVFYKWALNAGRGIIIGIELIALVALGYRFFIDRQIVDQHDKIKTQEILVSRQQKEEKLYRGIQERLKNIKTTNEETSAKVTIMNDILNTIAAGTFYSTNLTINQRNVSLDGSTFSIFTLNGFIEELKKRPSVSAISLDEITTADDGIKFKLKIEVKEQKNVPTVKTAKG